MGRSVPDPKRGMQLFLAILAICVCIATYFLLPEGLPESQKRVAIVFVFAVLFWGLHIIPLYATSLLIVLLLTFLLTSPLDLLGLGKNAFQYFLIPFSSPVIMLFLGGLTLAAAIHTHKVDAYFMEKALRHLGQKPLYLLMGCVGISAFFSMWISNTAAAAVMLAMVGPILVTFSADDPFRKAIVLAIAFGASLGGIGTPIGTPPNAIAIGIFREHGTVVDFFSWMLMAVPLVILLLSVTTCVLYLFFPPKIKSISCDSLPKPLLTKKGLGVLIIALLIIALWLTGPFHKIPVEIISLLGVGLFAAFRLISRKEFRSLPWEVLVMMWGGLALGEAVIKSGLSEKIAALPLAIGHPFWLIVFFCLIALFLTAFISNTATANLLLPIAMSIEPTLLPVTVAISCSLSLAFPISSPPNAITYGSGVFSMKDMIKSGSLISGSALVIMLMGYAFVVPWALYSR